MRKVASATFFIDGCTPVCRMSGMDIFNEHDMATAKGFPDANAYYADLHAKSMQAQEYDELRRTVERVFDNKVNEREN